MRACCCALAGTGACHACPSAPWVTPPSVCGRGQWTHKEAVEKMHQLMNPDPEVRIKKPEYDDLKRRIAELEKKERER